MQKNDYMTEYSYSMRLFKLSVPNYAFTVAVLAKAVDVESKDVLVSWLAPKLGQQLHYISGSQIGPLPGSKSLVVKNSIRIEKKSYFTLPRCFLDCN